ncbi:MAG: hypothetical protein LBT46_10225 [Planctomycetaceae bacterium]|jgi:hypothetical protein|nr:hypothetical protein [Planctomycetaceae bacterium]
MMETILNLWTESGELGKPIIIATVIVMIAVAVAGRYFGLKWDENEDGTNKAECVWDRLWTIMTGCRRQTNMSLSLFLIAAVFAVPAVFGCYGMLYEGLIMLPIVVFAGVIMWLITALTAN